MVWRSITLTCPKVFKLPAMKIIFIIDGNGLALFSSISYKDATHKVMKISD
jgi:hypothetical protein